MSIAVIPTIDKSLEQIRNFSGSLADVLQNFSEQFRAVRASQKDQSRQIEQIQKALHLDPQKKVSDDNGADLEKTIQKIIQTSYLTADVANNIKSDDQLNEFLSLKLVHLDLSVRLSNCLIRKANLSTVKDVLEKPLEELLEIKNFGEVTLEELRNKLEIALNKITSKHP